MQTGGFIGGGGGGVGGAGFGRALERKIVKAGIPFAKDVRFEGLQADFVLEPESKTPLILEPKNWAATPENLERAAKYVLQLREIAGPESFVVLPDEFDVKGHAGLIRVKDVAHLPAARRRRLDSSVTPSKVDRMVFAAMPFAREFDDVYNVAITQAAKSLGCSAKRSDEDTHAGDMSARVRALIEESAVVVADLSGSRPNVLYEFGYAHGIKKPTVALSRTEPSALPFDVRNWNILSYQEGGTHGLIEPLTKRLKGALGE